MAESFRLPLFCIIVLQARSVLTVIMLQYNECEVKKPDGSLDYNACTAEPLHLLRNANFKVEVTPESYTCGAQREAYCTLGIRDCAFCDAAIPTEAHPAEYLYDNMANSEQPDMTSWWQSITWTNYPVPLEINITMSFNKSYELQDDLVITFQSSRPKAMILEKSTDFGATWEPLQYYNKKCREFFPDGYSSFVTSANPDEVICTQEYSLEVPYSNGLVKLDVVRDRYELFLGQSLTDYEALYEGLNSTRLSSFLTFTDLRIRLLQPATDGKEALRKEQDLIRYYYGISDMEVVGGCFCNLHAKVCEVLDGSTVCDCKHNTEGPNCEKCKPLYNKRPWKPGFYLPYPYGTANECEKCECYDHADSCVYNATQERALCIDCYHNTTGIHCEQCIPGYYRNISLPLNDANICQDCNCEPLGVLENLMTCISPSGQCSCKSLVEGRRCDRCVDQYYGLLLSDFTQGECKPCLCNRDGTLFQSNVCDKENGQCPCKDHISSRDCSECQDGFYDFPRARPWTDCTDCLCDPGGSVSQICDKSTGQCSCKSGVTGRRCDESVAGHYAPALDSVQMQPKGGSCELATAISTSARPFTGRMFMKCFASQTVAFEDITPPDRQFEITWPHIPVVRYSFNASANPWTSASLEITVLGNSGVDMTWFYGNVNSTLSAECGDATGKYYDFNYDNIEPGYGLGVISNETLPLDPRCRYSATLSLGPDGGDTSAILIDSLVLVPDISASSIYNLTDSGTQAEYETCLHEIIAISTKKKALDYYRCRWLTFSVGTEVYKGAESCGCDGLGTRPSTICNTLGGQCSCKSGVIGRRCDICAPGYFNFTANGCQPCGCDPLGSSNLVCDYLTGQCPCQPFVAQLGQNNTRGHPADRTCSSCQQNYHGFHRGSGCELCACSVSGSLHSQCDDYGACACKETIGGDQCDQCLPGYFFFSETGCLSCNCSVSGSLSHICDFTTGQCECKANVQDVKCDVCAGDSFNLDESNPDGCQKCFCYGHGTSCISAPGYTELIIHSDSIMTSNWTDSSPLTLDDNLWLTRFGLTTNEVMYVSAPTQFLGDHLHAYGKHLEFDMRVLGGEDLDLSGTKPVILQGNGRTIYVDAVNVTISSDTSRISVRLTEHDWRYNATTKPDYFNMYAILADLEAIHIQRAFGSQIATVSNITMQGVRLALATDPPVHNVELCRCEPSRNVQGPSCDMCSDGFQRQTVNGSVYETCKACDCSSRSETVPPQCTPSDGVCLNCRNGTTGIHCELCSMHVTGAECDTCEDTFWGLGAEGCEPCNCDPVGASSTVCEKVDGQCPCQPHVTGRTCGECADNYYNLQVSGCQECDACYNLVYEEVNKLRDVQRNISIYVDNLRSQDNNTLLGPFRDRLRHTLQNMASLLAFLNEANNVDTSIAPDLLEMTGTLHYLEEVLEMDVSTGIFTVNNTIFHAEGFVAHAQKTHQQTIITSLDTYQIITDPIASMTSELEALLTELQEVENSISQISSGAMADATRVLAIVKRIEGGTSETHQVAEEALQKVQLATNIHANTTRRIMTLETDVAIVSNLGDSVTSEAEYLHGNATLARDEVLEAQENSTTMESISTNGPELQQTASQLESQAKELEESATIRENIILAGNRTILQDVMKAEDRTASLKMRVSEMETEATTLLDRGTAAYTEANTAHDNETQVFADAQNMLDVMQNFNQRALDVESQANDSLELVREIQGLSESSINTANNLQISLQLTSLSAEGAFDTANNSREQASELVEIYRPVYEDAKEIERIASPLLNDVKDIAQQVHAAATEDIEPARITCGGLESQVQAVENRTRLGEQKAQMAVLQVTETRSRIDDIMADLRNIRDFDTTAIDSLRKRVKDAREEFDRRQLAEAIRILREASEEQKAWIETMKARRDDAAIAVRRVRDIQQQLKP